MRHSLARTLALLVLCGTPIPGAFAQLGQTPRPQGTAADAAWRGLYLADIAFLRDLIQRKYIYAVYAAGDRHWQERIAHAARVARDDAGKVRDFGSYRAALLHYVAAFEDAHFSAYFSVRSDAARWPGFTVGYVAGKYLVARSTLADVASGAKVSACDGEPTEAWLDRLAEFYGGPRGRETTRAAIAPQLFVDRGNPLYALPRTCIIADEPVVLTWRPIPASRDSGPDQAPVRSGAAVPTLEDQALAIEEFGDDGAWVRIGTMMPSSREQAESFQRLIDAAPSLRAKSSVILDVRGNAGGTYNWFMAFLRGLYGSGYADHFATARLEIANVLFTPAGESPDSPIGLAGDAGQLIAPPDPPMTAMQSPRVERVVGGGQLLFMAPVARGRSAPEAAPASLFPGRVYVLADYGCASACLSFVDEMMRFPGVALLGTETHADRRSGGWPMGFELPSGLAVIRLGRMVREGRARGENQAWAPAAGNRFPGDIADSSAVRRWVRDVILPRDAAPITEFAAATLRGPE